MRVRRPRRSLAAGVGLNVGVVLPAFLAASLAVRIRDDFPFDDAVLGLALALVYLTSAVVSPAAGRLVARIGAVKGLYAAAALGAVSALGIAVAAGSAGTLIAFLVLGAVARALAQPGSAVLLTRHVAERRRGVAFGVQQSAPPAGALLAGLALPLIAIPLGWRWAFVAAALLTLACVAAVPRREAAGAARDGAGHLKGRRGLRPVHVVAVAAALASTAGLGLFSFIVIFAVREGMSAAEAGLLLGATGATAVATRVWLGAVADRGPRDLLRDTAALLVLCAGGFALLATATPVLIVAGALVAGGLGWGWQALATLAVVRQHPEAPAEAVSIEMTGFFAGAVVGPLLVGTLGNHAGFEVAWIVCAGLALLAAAAVAAANALPVRSPDPAR